VIDVGPAERVLARLRGRRAVVAVEPGAVYGWTPDELRRGLNDLMREVAELRAEVRRPAYGLWAAALAALAAALGKYAGG